MKKKSVKNKVVKKKAAKKSEAGMQALLELLRNQPELAHALMFDPAKFKRLLESEAARELIGGVDVREILRRQAAIGRRQGPFALCLRRTAHTLEADGPPLPDCLKHTFLWTLTLLCC